MCTGARVDGPEGGLSGRVRGEGGSMRWLVVRSAVVLALSALAGSLVVFLLLRLLGGDVATVILGRSATPQALAQLRAELGLDRPWVVQYFAWLGDLLRG